MAWIEEQYKALEGRLFTLTEMRRETLAIRVRGMKVIPPEMSAKHLLEYAVEKRWIHETDHGDLYVKIEDSVRKSSE